MPQWNKLMIYLSRGMESISSIIMSVLVVKRVFHCYAPSPPAVTLVKMLMKWRLLYPFWHHLRNGQMQEPIRKKNIFTRPTTFKLILEYLRTVYTVIKAGRGTLRYIAFVEMNAEWWLFFTETWWSSTRREMDYQHSRTNDESLANWYIRRWGNSGI